MVIEKIEVIGSHKNNLIDIFSVGQKIHDVVNTCGTNCGCYTYLSEIQFWTNLKKGFNSFNSGVKGWKLMENLNKFEIIPLDPLETVDS